MSVFVSHEEKDTVFCAFGKTLKEAHTNATSLETELQALGHHTHIDDFGSVLGDGLYGWNVMAKKIEYS